MKVFILLSVVALAVAKPTFLQTPIAYTAPFTYTAPVAYTAGVVPALDVASQYHSQDSLGQYSYGYTGGLSSKAESRSLDGVTRGAYSYVDANGVVQSVQYTADGINGFQVAATNLPVAPAAKAIELKPVEDTPEVTKAKTEHLAAVEEVKARLAATPAEVETPVVSTSPVVAPVTSYAYNYITPYTHGAYYPYSYGYGAYPYNTGFGYQFSPFAPGYYPHYNPLPGNYYHPFLTPIGVAPIAPIAANPIAPPAAPPVNPGSPVDEDTVEVKSAKKE